jgi:hypothetical protein
LSLDFVLAGASASGDKIFKVVKVFKVALAEEL